MPYYAPGITEAPTTGGTYSRRSSAWAQINTGPKHIAGRWYPQDIGLSLVGGASLTLNRIRLQPLIIYSPISISDVFFRVTTLVAASAAQVGIYAADSTTLEPTGTALATTADMATTATALVTSALSGTIAVVPGQYWIGVMVNTSGVVFMAPSAAQGFTAAYRGSTTAADVNSSATLANFALDYAATYGVWPDLTAVSPAIVTMSGAGNGAAHVGWKAA